MRLTVLDRASVEIPVNLMSALEAEGMTAAFKSVSPGKRTFLIRRIDEAVKPVTRATRIQDAVVAAQRRRIQH